MVEIIGKLVICIKKRRMNVRVMPMDKIDTEMNASPGKNAVKRIFTKEKETMEKMTIIINTEPSDELQFTTGSKFNTKEDQ